MKKTKKSLSSEAFESVCSSWEQRMKEFIFLLSDGSIPTLRDVEWTIEKKRVFVTEPDANGKKKRGASGPHFSSYTSLNRTAAEAVWKNYHVVYTYQGNGAKWVYIYRKSLLHVIEMKIYKYFIHCYYGFFCIRYPDNLEFEEQTL